MRSVAPTVIAVVALFIAVPAPTFADEPSEEGWVQLFNGKDLTGWKIPNPPSSEFESVTAKTNDEGKVVAYIGRTKKGKDVTLWRVEDGLLIGGGPASHLFTERDDYDDFRFRIVVKINDKGNSGQYFRTEFGPGFPKGYEAQINATHADPVKTGSLYPNGSFGLGKYRNEIAVLNKAPIEPEEFYTQEVIADGPKITIRVNGKTTSEFTDPEYRFKKGHFALQGHDPGSVMTFKTIEYMPLKK